MRRAALALALLFAPSIASANGRFPLANQLVVDPSDPQRVVVRATFGVLQSTDGGVTWRFICERRVGFSGTFDPAIALASDGSLLAGLPDGLSRTTDRACTFARTGAPLDREYVVDLATHPSRVLAVTAPVNPSLPHAGLVAQSLDRGATFQLVPSRLPDDFVAATIDVAPSRPERVYISGVGPFKAFASLLRSDDGGATFSESTFDMGGARAPYIAAIDPVDPDRVWLRLDGDDSDRLALSRDGAVTFTDVRALAELLGFALSPDGTRVAIGGPSDGLWIARTSDLAFAKVNNLRVRCLTWTPAGLWACADNDADGFAVGLSRDDGRTFEPKLRLAALEPLACSAESCAEAWSALAPVFRASPDAGAPDAAAPLPVEVHADGGGCGCTTTLGNGSPFVSLAILLALLARRGISSVRPRLPCGRNHSEPPWPSASPSRSSS